MKKLLLYILLIILFSYPALAETVPTSVVVSNNDGSITSDIARIDVNVPIAPPVITIHTQPVASTDVTEGSIIGNLFVEASISEGGIMSYQWFSTTNTYFDGTLIHGATSSDFLIPSTLTASGSPYYYYCLLEGTYPEIINLSMSKLYSEIATVTVISEDASIGKHSSGGGCNNTIADARTFGIMMLLSALLAYGFYGKKKKKNSR